MKKLRKNDDVIVLSGRDRGKRGKVTRVMADGRLVVSGVNMQKKHQKPNPQLGMAGGIVEREGPIQASNVAIYNASTQRADRVGFRRLDDGTKARFFKSNGEQIES